MRSFSGSGGNRFTIATMCFVIACVAIVLAGWRIYGAYGIGPAFGIVGLIWFGLSRVKSSALYPINRQRMTVLELLVILAISFNLYLISLPDVSSHSRPRRALPVPTAPEPSASKGANG